MKVLIVEDQKMAQENMESIINASENHRLQKQSLGNPRGCFGVFGAKNY